MNSGPPHDGNGHVSKIHVMAIPCDAACPHFSAKRYTIISRSIFNYKNIIQVYKSYITKFGVGLEHTEISSRDCHFHHFRTRRSSEVRILHREGHPAHRVQILYIYLASKSLIPMLQNPFSGKPSKKPTTLLTNSPTTSSPLFPKL